MCSENLVQMCVSLSLADPIQAVEKSKMFIFTYKSSAKHFGLRSTFGIVIRLRTLHDCHFPSAPLHDRFHQDLGDVSLGCDQPLGLTRNRFKTCLRPVCLGRQQGDISEPEYAARRSFENNTKVILYQRLCSQMLTSA